MRDINEVLMRRNKITPVKRKRSSVTSSASKKVAASSRQTMSIMRFSTATTLEELSRPTLQVTPHSSPERRKGKVNSPTSTTSSMYDSPQASAPTTQAYIDLGQKDFGKHTTCRRCGLLYTVGELEDEKEHQRFCRKQQKGITLSKWKSERLMKAFPDDDARIIEIRREDLHLHVKKLLEMKDVLDDALGFVEEEVFLDRGHFLYVQGRQIVGCATSERISEAYKLESGGSAVPGVELPTTNLTISKGVAPAVAGISQIWVHPQFRGRSIATRLVDVVREKFIYGLRISKNRLAFAQPTSNGLAFASNYVHPHPVLVYDSTSRPESPGSSS